MEGKPNINYFRTWGCLAQVKLMYEHTSMVGPKRTNSTFIRYSMTSKTYIFLNLETPDPHTIIESTNVEFFKDIFLF